uniref:Uncharacterized protein n=1 Tax=mine drainage metagenome TaxID=410659 RepID=E6QUP1_9ZZZZ
MLKGSAVLVGTHTKFSKADFPAGFQNSFFTKTPRSSMAEKRTDGFIKALTALRSDSSQQRHLQSSASTLICTGLRIGINGEANLILHKTERIPDA